MGNRRMMSKTVTQTQRFLTLPIEAQALYFHMLQNTDDDGVCEAYMLLKLTGLKEDTLNDLIDANLVTELNDELVYYVTDFHEQNYIDKRRYNRSVYFDLLDEMGILSYEEYDD
ncbi:TPA: hypothetical protein U1V37_000062 [Streptococcus suis]|nr:hypothetical protein [Streptococcus suis]HEM3952341.1 hypothetical protein [Streptococcus suis]